MMNAIEFRDATFMGIRGSLDAKRASVYTAWMVYGPGTTRRVSGESGIDLLTFRPRTTELLQCGLITVVSGEANGREGVYRVTPEAEWEDWRRGQVSGQQRLL